MFIYPTANDNPEQYVPLIGTFWTSTYGGANLVLDYLRSMQLNQQQLFGDIVELQRSVGYRTCPIYHRANWYKVSFFQSQEIAANHIEYGDGHVFGVQPSGTVITFGQIIDTAVAYPCATDLARAYLATNQFTNPNSEGSLPTFTLTEGVSFFLDTTTHQLIFLQSLFNNPQLTPTPVLDASGNVIDMQIDLYFFRARLDWNYLSQQFGYIVGLDLPSSPTYKDFLVGLLSGIASGTSYDNVAQVLEAISGSPRVLSDDETVEYITNDATTLLIITDKNVYHFSQAATPIVTVGQVVNQDDQLTDVVTIYEPTNGTTPPLDQLSLGAGFLDPAILGELIWQNQLLPTTVSTVDGYTQITWPLGGATADVANFFTIFLNKGIAAGKTLAQCMDTRPQPQTTQPGPSNLPTQINPMSFLFQNVLRDNAFVVVFKVSEFGPNALGTGQAALLRDLVPPTVTLIFFMLVTQAEDNAVMNGDGDTLETGYTEDYTVFTV